MPALQVQPVQQKPRSLPGAKSAWADSHAPSVMLPLRFMIFGIFCLPLTIGLIVARPEVLTSSHDNQHVIAATHLFVLGFLLSALFGALYQFVPVALETRLHSEKLGHWHFPVQVLGVSGLAWMFWVWNLKMVWVFAAAWALGAAWFVYNMARTLARVPSWSPVAAGMAAGLAWLLVTLLTGVYLAVSKLYPSTLFPPQGAMQAHAHAGIIGVFAMLIVAVSYKMIPMFARSELQSAGRAGWSLGLLNLGLAGLLAASARQSLFNLLCTFLIIAGLSLYGIEIRSILRARRRHDLDFGLKYFVTGLIWLIPCGILALMLSWPNQPLAALAGQMEKAFLSAPLPSAGSKQGHPI